MRQKKYDILLWDVDGTLLNFLASEREALFQAFAAYDITIDEEIYQTDSEINLALWKKLEKGEVTRLEVLRNRFTQLFALFAPGERFAEKGIAYETLAGIDIEDFRAKYQHGLGSVYFYQEDSLTLCQKLKEEGFYQYIITNGVTWTQTNKLKLAGFDKVMRQIFISEEIGYNKPDIRFFETCMEKIRAEGVDVPKDRILVIGDSMTSDIQLAKNAGVDCCLYDPAKTERKAGASTYVIDHLSQLEAFLWQKETDRD